MTAAPSGEAAVADYVQRLERAGVQPEDLDDLVHDAAAEDSMEAVNSTDDEEEQEEELETAANRAADINNDGLEAQVRFLLESGEHDGLEEILRERVPRGPQPG